MMTRYSSMPVKSFTSLAIFRMWLKNLNNSKFTLTYENKFY